MVIWLQALGARADGLPAPRVARFKGDAQAAFSYTFDDGFAHQVENALSVIEPLGIKGTFFVMPLSMEQDPGKFVSWERLREINANGHEVGTHASINPKLHEVTPEAATAIINGGWQLIRDKLGVPPVSFAYPGGSRRDVPELQAIVAQHHYFIRGKAVGYGSTAIRNWTQEEARLQVDHAIESGEWLVAFVHAIVDGYSPFKSVEEFEEHSRWLLAQSDHLWIAPFGEVGRYVQERDAARLRVLHSDKQSMLIEIHCPLRPVDVYNYPLTVVLSLPPDKHQANASYISGGPAILQSVQSGVLHLDIVPHAGPVRVEFE